MAMGRRVDRRAAWGKRGPGSREPPQSNAFRRSPLPKGEGLGVRGPVEHRMMSEPIEFARSSSDNYFYAQEYISVEPSLLPDGA